MFQSDITIGTNTFSKVVVRPMSSSYADNNQTLTNPRILQISHEVAKSGRVSTAVILDDTANVAVGTSLVASNVRVLTKISYNPLEGRADLDAAIKAAIVELNTFLSAEANVAKLLNKES